MEKTNFDEIICESCGEKFGCGAKNEQCWCFNVEISPPTLAELKEDFQRCLCRQCLEKIESAKILNQY